MPHISSQDDLNWGDLVISVPYVLDHCADQGLCAARHASQRAAIA